jgi:hypothetical protein
LPPRDAHGRTVWVTRSRPKVDRIACPWLIRRFIDPDAVFLFVPAAEVAGVAEQFNAAPFDVDDITWAHRGPNCTFDAMIEELGLRTEPLLRLAAPMRSRPMSPNRPSSLFTGSTPAKCSTGSAWPRRPPGLLTIALQFVGFMAAFRTPGAWPPLLAGVAGGLLTTWVTFVPCFLRIFLGAPYVERLRDNKALTGALSAITAAVVGVVLNLAVWFTIHTIFRQTVPVRGFGFAFDLPIAASVDPWALLLCAGAVLAIFRFKAGLSPTLAASAAAGVALYLAGLMRFAAA